MRRLASTIRNDAVLQFRAGFYFVGAAVAFFYVGLLRLIPDDWPLNLGLLIPAALTINVMVTTFYFVAGLVLFEKSEQTLPAIAVTPLRVGEYLGSKVASLTVLALAENAIILFEPALLISGLVLLCAIYTLAGLVTISRYESINSFLIPSVFVVTALLLPLLMHFGAVDWIIMYLHPVQPALSLISAAFLPVGRAEIIYGFVGGLAWLGIAYVLARRALDTMAVR